MNGQSGTHVEHRQRSIQQAWWDAAFFVQQKGIE
jgi:hypothetical protein